MADNTPATHPDSSGPMPAVPAKKLRVGFFSFTGCEGCMVEFTEILNEKYFEWAPLLDVVYFRLIKGKNKLAPMDVAFIEGAISSEKEALRMQEIRRLAAKVVAIGSCAITGAPNNYRNNFDEKTIEEIRPILERFHHRPKVTGIGDVVKVDAQVPGCPILHAKFIEVMENYMREFGVLPPLPKKEAPNAEGGSENKGGDAHA
ncbi:Sulfhydrogenase 1 subunit delta [uncultured archaeon]|nr:Sulfhydrogenase 1 subunit delta [uncultured archaeon]